MPDRGTIVFLNRCYWPDSEATGQLLTDLCRHLAGRFDVHVICGQPNSPLSDDYERKGIQVRDGVTIHRLAHTEFAKRKAAGRLVNLLSFSHATDRYLRKFDLPIDVLISETDPFFLPLVGARHARRSGCQFICYLQDIYPDVAEAIGKVKSGRFTDEIRRQLRSAYQLADRVIVLGRCMKRRLESEPWSIGGGKIEIIPNWADCDAIQPIPHDQNPFRAEHGLHDKFVVMHSGNMGLTQRLDVLVEATRQPDWPEQALLLLVGDGAARKDLERRAQHCPPGRVRFLPYQPRERLSESLSAGDLHVVSMHEKITGCLCPSKLYGILAAGRPVLAIADAGTDLVQTVDEHELGWCSAPGDPRDFIDKLGQAVLAVDARSRSATRSIALRRFDRPVVADSFTKQILELESDRQSLGQNASSLA